MKKKELKTKLVLGKEIITNLDKIKGGSNNQTVNCPTPPPSRSFHDCHTREQCFIDNAPDYSFNID